MITINLVYFAVSCLFLAASAIALVKLLKEIAILLHITDFAAAFIIMAAATSLPELFVGITSAVAKKPSLSFGNILGADILDLTLFLGIMIILAGGIKVKEKGVKRDSYVMILMLLLPIILYIIGGSISRSDGLILLASYGIYTAFTLNTRRERKEKEKAIGMLKRILIIIIFVICLFILFKSANAVVKYASILATELNLPPIVIGLFLISIATTLPELGFGIASALMKQGEMALGDQVGTVIFNSTFIVGVTALIYPITTTFTPFIIASAFLILSSILCAKFTESDDILSVKEGIALLAAYVLFVIFEFYIKTI